jgi:hypothetical protein
MSIHHKCNVNFQSKWAFIGERKIHVEQYIPSNENEIKCNHGHELVFCNGKKREKYFRHKNTNDIGGYRMTQWHCNWQSLFAITEHILPQKEGQMKERRADVLIEGHNYIIEFEHSGKTPEDVKCKHDDCLLHDMNIIWLVDGNTDDVVLEELSSGGFLMSFEKDWKYKSFLYNYEFILLDINDKIFKIPVRQVCNKMILLKEWKTIENIVNILNTNPSYLWNEWCDDNEIKATLTVHQKGAGNGKTYGIWKSIAENLDKKVFIIVTKQHSAKEVIRKELCDQAERNEYHIANMIEKKDSETARKIVITYKHKQSSRQCKVIIATIDSFIFNLTNNHKGNSNFWESLLHTISDCGITKVNKHNGQFKFAGETLYMDKNMELWIDEAQDLGETYFKAIVKVIIETKIDVVIVGDKLQSLEHRINFMTCIENDIPNIRIIREPPINENRRIRVQGMAAKINNLISFDDYNLPNIYSNENELDERHDLCLETFDTPTVYNIEAEDNRNKIEQYITKIIYMVDKEVKSHNYRPNDFLFIFPIMQGNLIAPELETKLNNYWINHFPENDKYMNYAFLHKHQEGQSIDMSESEEASRIVTIRTSKGDGRKVVFVLECTEASLKIVSRCDEIDLIYESYLHVALTRAKEKIYFGIKKNNDDIHKRFGCSGELEYKPTIKPVIQIDKLCEYIDKNRMVQILNENGINAPSKDDSKQFDINKAIDWEFYCIRRAIYLQYAIFTVLKNGKECGNFEKSQIKVILNNICKLTIKDMLPIEFYKFLDKTESFDGIFPLCNLSDKPIYKNYMNKIKTIMNDNIKKLNIDLFSLVNMTPYASVFLNYMIEVYRRKKYCETSPSTLYNIVNNYENKDSTKITELLDESRNIKNVVTKAMDSMSKNDPDNINWNIEHMIKFNGKNDYMKIWYRNIPIIGHSKTNVYHLLFISDFNQLNFYDILITVMIERFIIFNAGEKGDDIKKFNGKNIKTYIFILKQNKYELFDFTWDSNEQYCFEIKQLVKNAVVKHFASFNKELFYYCKFVKKSGKWKSGKEFTTPFDFISNEYKDTDYIKEFFKYLHERSKTDRNYGKTITDDIDIFNENLTEKIEESCNSFFGLNDCTNDDDEW